jgi:uncharacterized protein YqjF (DUF2071 family)
MSKGPKPFLTARWESLLMLNYDCPPELLLPLLPPGVELDTWQGRTMMSMVGFLFLDTRVKGLRAPGCQNFEEVNLRFYVRRLMPDGEARRGVVFVKELVPRPLVAWAAKSIYEEPYQTVSMGRFVDLQPDKGGKAEYSWRLGSDAFLLTGRAKGPALPLVEGSEEEFITEHYWGYTKRSRGTTSEYEVTHPRWNVWRCTAASFSGDASRLYGPDLARLLKREPQSALMAVGSEVAVFPGRRLP